MFSTSELEIFKWAVGAILAANILAMVLFVLFARLPNDKLREKIRGAIFVLDKFADCMENEIKRAKAIQQVNDVLGWRRILIPSALVGWVIDAEVAAIRRMQKVTYTPDLYIEEVDNDAKDNTCATKADSFTEQK